MIFSQHLHGQVLLNIYHHLKCVSLRLAFPHHCTLSTQTLIQKVPIDTSVHQNNNYSYQSGKVGEGQIESLRLISVYYFI